MKNNSVRSVKFKKYRFHGKILKIDPDGARAPLCTSVSNSNLDLQNEQSDQVV